MGTEARVTVGFVPRERFAIAAEALRSIVDGTAAPLQLVIVDALIPAPYRSAMDEVLGDRDGVRVIVTAEHLLPNASKNLLLAQVVTPYVCMVENDIVLDPGCIDRLLATAEEEDADVVVPMFLEGRSRHHHYDAAMGFFEWDTLDGRRYLRIAPLATAEELDGFTAPRRVDMTEAHAVLYRTETLRRSGLFDEHLSMNEFVDDSLSLKKAGARMILEPRAKATFIPPPPVRPDERPFFDFRWSPGSAEAATSYLQQKWKIDVMPVDLDVTGAREFLRARHYQTSSLAWAVYVVRTRWRWPLGRVKNRVIAALLGLVRRSQRTVAP